jgi:hypothetical protein
VIFITYCHYDALVVIRQFNGTLLAALILAVNYCNSFGFTTTGHICSYSEMTARTICCNSAPLNLPAYRWPLWALRLIAVRPITHRRGCDTITAWVFADLHLVRSGARSARMGLCFDLQ